MILVPPDGTSVCAGAGCGDGSCLALRVPLLFDLMHRQHVHTHTHRMTSSTRIPPPTPPPIAAAKEDETEVESMETEM